MNSFILEVTSLENKIIENKNIFSEKIYRKLLDIIEEKETKNLKVSNIFGMFFEKNIELMKGKKYRIRIVTKNQKIFSKIQSKLFEIAINKEEIEIDEMIFSLAGINTKDETWCGEYKLENKIKKINDEDFNFSKKVLLKVVTPIIENKKSIYGFNKIFNMILSEIENERIIENMEGLKESIENSIIIRREVYHEKRKSLLNDEIKKIYLGDIELELQGYYGKWLYLLLQYIRFSGVGDNKEYGFGEIILK